MPDLTTEQRSTVDSALAFLESLIECYQSLPADARNIPDEQVEEIERVVEALQTLNTNGGIDFGSERYTILASADSGGIHLNENWGNDYTNDYELPDDYNLDNCDNGHFGDLWRLIEILLHENYHYERHSGVGGSFRKLGIVLMYGTVGNVIEGLTNLLTDGPHLDRRYIGHEHHAYSYAHHLLFWFDSMLGAIWLSDDPCTPCPYEHMQRARSASERQDPYEWVD